MFYKPMSINKRPEPFAKNRWPERELPYEFLGGHNGTATLRHVESGEVETSNHKTWWRRGVLTWPQYRLLMYTAQYHFFLAVLSRYVRRKKYVTPKELDEFYSMWIATHGHLTDKGWQEFFRLQCGGGAINMPRKWTGGDGMLSLYNALSWKAKYQFDYDDAKRFANRIAANFDNSRTERDRLGALNYLTRAIQKCARIKPMKKEMAYEAADNNG